MNLSKGIDLLKIAIEKDENHQLKEALENYINSFEYLMTGLKYIEIITIKNKIREKIIEFMPRAEKLKEILEKEIEAENDKNKKSKLENNSPPSHLRKAIEETIITTKQNRI